MNDRFYRVLFTEPGKAVFSPADSSALSSGTDQVVIETEYSIVSAGTELAILSGGESWAPLPFTPGYGSVGRVVRIGSNVKDVKVGQRIFTYGAHSQYAVTDIMRIPVEDTVDPVKATFARIAAVSITSLRVSDAALGDYVAVFGLGLVGNLAAQLFTLAGCEVIGIDLSAQRREQALQCGIAHVLTPGADLAAQVAAITGGRGCRSVVEATGVPAVAATAGTLAGKQGEVILLGSPRQEYVTNLTNFLNQSHLWGSGCITVKGAHEWRYPVAEDPQGYGRFSMEGNVRAILRLIGQKKLQLDPLVTHVVSPKTCQEVYDGLKNQKDVYTGVVFDWSK